MTTIPFLQKKNWKESLIEQAKNTTEKSFRVSLNVYGELLAQKGNRWVKNTEPVPMQRLSEDRAYTDVLRAYYFKKNPDTNRCRGYNHVAANRGNDLIITTKKIVDIFGNVIEAWSILQLNGNTNLVAQCQLLNGEVAIPNDYTLDEFIAPKGEKLDFDVTLVSTQAELNFHYDTIDNTTSSKSKDDNYSSCLVGHGLLNYETGETDLVSWTTKDMDRPLSYLVDQTVPKDIPSMNIIVTEYLNVIKNVREETTSIVNNGNSNKAIWKAFCLDISQLELSKKFPQLQVTSFLDNLSTQIKIASDCNVEEYWSSRFFGIKLPKGSSKIGTKLNSFRKFICSPKSSWVQLCLTAEDWILWELFSVDRDSVRDIQDHRLYGHGGCDILGGKDRKDSAHQALNFLRIILLFGISINFNRRFSATEAFEWAAENIAVKCSAIDQVDRLDILSDKKVKSALKSYIYS
jgi:hypothetical protein